MTLTLMNFIIAIFSDTYAINSERKTSLYLQEVIFQRSSMLYTEASVWKVSANVPFNLILYAINIPVKICCVVNKKKENKIMYLMTYMMIVPFIIVIKMGVIALSLVANVLFIPYQFSRRKYKGKPLSKFASIIVFLFFLILITVFFLFYCIGFILYSIYFWRLMLVKDTNTKKLQVRIIP